jgi:hypothetical protein
MIIISAQPNWHFFLSLSVGAQRKKKKTKCKEKEKIYSVLIA